MPKRRTAQELSELRKLLSTMYHDNNLTISEIGKKLGCAPQTVYDRMQAVGLQTDPGRKQHFCNRNVRITIPSGYSEQLAEFIGVMMGDGHVSRYQATVTIGRSEVAYVQHVRDLAQEVFGGRPGLSVRKDGHHTVYLSSAKLVCWLLQHHNLAPNKHRAQVQPPTWLRKSLCYEQAFIRGVFDTDGSVYALRHGIQIAFINTSLPLLRSLHEMLKRLNYKPSRVNGFKLYITRRNDVDRFFREVGPANRKHVRRYEQFRQTRT